MLAATVRNSMLLLCLGLASQAQADSSTSSAASMASQSLGTLSNSVGTSSKSSTSGDKVADGNYRVIDVAVLNDRPGMLRVRMQVNADTTGQDLAPTAANNHAELLWLDLPQKAWGGSGLAKGDLLNVRNQGYGLVFARAAAAPQQGAAPDSVFFLALNDVWRSDMDLRAVKL